MRFVVWLVLMAVIAVVAANTLGANDGLVSFYFRGWKLDLSLNLFVLLLAATCIVVVLLMQGLSALLAMPQRAHEWRVSRRDRSAQAALRDALAQYFGGRFSRAQKAAQRALSLQSETPELAQDNEFTVLGHLLAAGSAHRLQDRGGRDAQLASALEISKRSAAARSAEEGARLLAAEWALEDRDAERATELLAELPSGVARRTQALRLKLQAARLARQPQEALRTARLLAKHQGFSRAAAQGLLRALAFESLATARDLDQLRAVWLAFDAADRRDPFVVARAVAHAAGYGAFDEARSWLRPLWEQLTELAEDERIAVAEALVACVDGIGADWLPRLEAATQALPRDGAVALAVGTALAERGIWGKARMLLEAAADDLQTPVLVRRRAWLALAKIAREQGDAERAARCHEAAATVG